MPAVKWTPRLVEERLAEAASVLERLPEPQWQGYFNTWPEIILPRDGKTKQKPKSLDAIPSPAAISRMEETLGWTVGLAPVDSRIIWLRAYGARWKTICRSAGLQRSAAHEHWVYALCVIAFRLNGRRLNRTCSKRKVIERAGAAQR